MKKRRHVWILSSDPLCDNPTTLVSQCSRPMTFVFSIYYAYLSECWAEGQRYQSGWRFTCNIWFSNIASSERDSAGTPSGRTTVSLTPYYNDQGYTYFDRDHEVRASNPHYATEAQCIEAAIRHIAARLDMTLTYYPDIIYYLLRPECYPFFNLYQALTDKERWLDEVRARSANHPNTFVGLSPQLQLF